MTSKIASFIGFAAFVATLVMLVGKAFGAFASLGFLDVFFPLVITTGLSLFLLAFANFVDSVTK